MAGHIMWDGECPKWWLIILYTVFVFRLSSHTWLLNCPLAAKAHVVSYIYSMCFNFLLYMLCEIKFLKVSNCFCLIYPKIQVYCYIMPVGNLICLNLMVWVSCIGGLIGHYVAVCFFAHSNPHSLYEDFNP